MKVSEAEHHSERWLETEKVLKTLAVAMVAANSSKTLKAPGFILICFSLWDLDAVAGTAKCMKGPALVLDSFEQIARVEWDTMLFFFGIIFAVGGLGVLGYLGLISEYLYVDLGPTTANVAIGALSAIVDNIPMMFAVLTMDPRQSDAQVRRHHRRVEDSGRMRSVAGSLPQKGLRPADDHGTCVRNPAGGQHRQWLPSSNCPLWVKLASFGNVVLRPLTDQNQPSHLITEL